MKNFDNELKPKLEDIAKTLTHWSKIYLIYLPERIKDPSRQEESQCKTNKQVVTYLLFFGIIKHFSCLNKQTAFRLF